MAHHKSAKKRILQTAVKTERNRYYRTRIKNLTKAVLEAVEAADKKAAEAALGIGHQHINTMVEQYRRRRDIAMNILKKHGLYSYTPQGAFYVLIDISSTGMDSDAFADRILSEQKVALAPGITFGELSRKYVRVSLATDGNVIVEGLERVCTFIRANSKN